MAGEFEALAVRVEAADGPDRELDLAIHLALDPDGRVARVIASGKRGLNQRLGQSWDIEARAVHYETWNEHSCFANGSIPVACYSASLDAALSIAPEGLAASALFDAIHVASREQTDTLWKAALPRHLCAAALRARAHSHKES